MEHVKTQLKFLKSISFDCYESFGKVNCYCVAFVHTPHSYGGKSCFPVANTLLRGWRVGRGKSA